LESTLVSVLPWVFKLIVTLWLLAIAYGDWRRTIIPNRLTFPAIILFGGWRAVRGAWHILGLAALRFVASPGDWAKHAGDATQAGVALQFTLVAWVLCLALWTLHVVGGGDAKTLMALFALFPTSDFAVFLSLSVLALGLPVVLLKLRGRRLSDVPAALVRWLKAGHLFPSERQLEEEGKPYVWMFCLPGVVYLWFLW
jgi:Flp pilus assembly protein protease CpaA